MKRLALAAAIAACGSSSPAHIDATPHDSPTPSADAPTDACTTCPPPSYQDITQATYWLSYDLTGVTSASAGYGGGTFDGRYVYFAPESSTLVRYDTQSGAFTTQTSWAKFDASVVDASAGTFAGAVFDGRYVYYVPDSRSKLLRYDTHASFTDPGSYLAFDIGSIDHTTHGFVGATFDGRYLYFSPWYVPGSYQSVAFQYDTQAPLTQTTSWASYDLSNIDLGCEGYFGALFDGRYVTFVPLRHQSNQKNGEVVRFDTTMGPFTNAGAFSMFDATTADAGAGGFAGGAFDGTRLYFAPLMASAASYDTTLTFSSTMSWKASTQIASMEFGGFDGKYVYFGPSSGTTIARVDSTADFQTAGSWSHFDMATLTPAVAATSGMIYDGRYMYFPPSGGNQVAARFDTKSGTVMPALPQFHGSFY